MRGISKRDAALIQGQIWTPAALRGAGKLAAWWDAGDIAQISIATGISALRDKAGLQNASQATAGNQRPWSAIGWRGMRPAITGSGNKYVTFSGISYNGTNGMSAMCVVEQNAVAASRSILSGVAGAPQFRFDTANTLSVIRTGQANIATSSAVATGYHLAGFDVATSLTNIWVDGTALVAGSANGAFTQPVNCLCEQNAAGGEGFNGAFGAVVISALKWSNWERQLVEGYLAWEWDGGVAGLLVGQLPPSHPYKNSPPLLAGAVRLRRPLVNAGLAAINASLTSTSAADTSSSAAKLKLQASVSTTEAADSRSSTASLKLQGALAAAETADSLASAAKIKLQATEATTEAADTLVSAGAVKLQATASITEAADTLASSAAKKVQATLSATESADTLTAAGSLKVQATQSGLEQADTLAASATVKLQAAAAVLEAPDTLAASGALLIQGDIAATETADSLGSIAGGQTSIIANLDSVEGRDALTSTARHVEAQSPSGRAFSIPHLYPLPKMQKTTGAQMNATERGDTCAATATISFDLVAIDNDWLLLAA